MCLTANLLKTSITECSYSTRQSALIRELNQSVNLRVALCIVLPLFGCKGSISPFTLPQRSVPVGTPVEGRGRFDFQFRSSWTLWPRRFQDLGHILGITGMAFLPLLNSLDRRKKKSKWAEPHRSLMDEGEGEDNWGEEGGRGEARTEKEIKTGTKGSGGGGGREEKKRIFKLLSDNMMMIKLFVGYARAGLLKLFRAYTDIRLELSCSVIWLRLEMNRPEDHQTQSKMGSIQIHTNEERARTLASALRSIN